MDAEEKLANILINRVLSVRKMCEGEMKLIICNEEGRFKKQYLVYSEEEQSVQNGQQDPCDDSKNVCHSQSCKIQYEILLSLTNI